jgi:erythromycin esterase-like protein
MNDQYTYDPRLHRLALDLQAKQRALVSVLHRKHQLEEELEGLEEQEREIVADCLAIDGQMIRVAAGIEAMPTGYEQVLEVEAHG